MRRTSKPNSSKDKVFSAIVLANIGRERRTLSKYACKSNKGARRNPDLERVPDRGNIRPIFFHDTDKIIHSKAYARYIDKTQVFSLFENDHITHRVLHVQFVSKIARVIGRCLRLNEDLIEAIALGHDLGHVPYGHDGEKVLHALCQENKIGCFCHNAQSVRFLMEIENKGKGLNLSLQVLDGILAHNGEILNKKYEPNFNKTWDDFEKEYKKCFAVPDFDKKIIPMTLEGCVVRISDIIAYIGRDIEDAIVVKLIKRTEIPTKVRDIIGSSNNEIINKLVLDLVKNSYGKDYLAFSDNIFKALDKLKTFNNEQIYLNPIIKTETNKIQTMFRQLYGKYVESLEGRLSSSIGEYFLNEMNNTYKKHTNNKRKVIDYIAGMTDDFFNNQYNELFFPKSYGYCLKKEFKNRLN